MIEVTVANHSTVLSDDAVRGAIPALQHQVDRDWAPAWGFGARLVFVEPNQPAAVGYGFWTLALFDDTDQAADLGYHEEGADGFPLGKVFAKTDADCGLPWTMTASHELVEMLGDPDATKTVTVAGKEYALEVADPVEDLQFSYLIDGVRVSNFTMPRYWLPGAAPDQMDQTNALPHDCGGCPTLLAGGYASVRAGGTWSQVYGELSPCDMARAPRGFHRRHLRAR